MWRALVIVPLVAIALAVSGWLAFTPRRPAARAHALARMEIGALLDSGERVITETAAARREAWSYYHPAHGVLAATDRRLLWVGVVPRGAIEWSAASEPPAFETLTWTYDSVAVEPTRVMFGLWVGLAVGSGSLRVPFAVRTHETDRHRRIRELVATRQAELRAEAERIRLEQERAAWEARQPVYYDVQRGDAVSSIAERFGITPDSLRALNGLTGDRIRVGQRLLVKPGG